MTSRSPIPTATYRLQFNRNFTFSDAAAVAGYLHELGVSHIYASPYLKARAGSPHGYDIVDHNALNPEIGDESNFNGLFDVLRQHDMGQILDIVPNHMAVGGADNAWWLDVLENGEASEYAHFFDIDWHPTNPVLQHRVLLPFLGDRYGAVLDRGELRLAFDLDQGAFYVEYFEHRFPIDPRTYPDILASHATEHRVTAAAIGVGSMHTLGAIIRDCRSIPRRIDLAPEQRRLRRQRGTASKQALAVLCRDNAALCELINDNLARLNGTPGKSRSFDRLHRLLEAQAWRLAYWQVATDEINYRRFFDINGLAGLRMEDHGVFEATHGLILKLVGEGKVDGLRIDHPDGLYDPRRYFSELQRAIDGESDKTIYLLAEKILAGHERLPAEWPVAGTTGYETAALINGLFVYPGSERRLTRLYRRFTAANRDFDEVLYERKKFITRDTLSGELAVLANSLYRIAQADRHTRDFTYHGLLDALTEVVACFPVYRTYVRPDSIGEQDKRYVQWAIARARKRSPAADTIIFDFIRSVLLLENFAESPPALRDNVAKFAMRFQQYTAPVMAKGLEDTAFYIFNRLVSLNDVGFDPKVFGISPAAFHHQNRQRLTDWPLSMVSTSTHDSKRSEDVRARISVLSELAEEWQRRIARWGRLNRPRKRIIEDQFAPSRNDEYLLYQTLVGAWPLEPMDADAFSAFRTRIEDYMLKAVREAKVHTSWINPNREYEDALCQFIRALLGDLDRGAFISDFLPFQRRVARFGLLNSLSQTALKFTVPGIPDTYQGNEVWTFRLVDPDNRQPIDYAERQRMLSALREATADATQLPEFVQDLFEHLDDGRSKLYVTWKTLTLRREHPELFRRGDYLGLEVSGTRADHVCAFLRRWQDRTAIVAAGRWFARLSGEAGEMPIGSAWSDTWIDLPADLELMHFTNLFTGQTLDPIREADKLRLPVHRVFAALPVAVLVS